MIIIFCFVSLFFASIIWIVLDFFLWTKISREKKNEKLSYSLCRVLPSLSLDQIYNNNRIFFLYFARQKYTHKILTMMMMGYNHLCTLFTPIHTYTIQISIGKKKKRKSFCFPSSSSMNRRIQWTKTRKENSNGFFSIKR